MSSERISSVNHLPGDLVGASYFRRLLAALCLLGIGTLWWYLASTPASDKVLGLYSMKVFVGLLVASYLLSWAVYFVLSSESFPGKAARLILTTLSFIIVVGLLEVPVTLGLVDYRKIISPPDSFLVTHRKPWDNVANVFDKELMHIHPPGQRIVGETSGDLVKLLGISTHRRYAVDLSFDSRGFRNDREIDRAPVVVTGDSFIEGVLVPSPKLVTNKLRDLLGVEVANLGQSGYGPQQELWVLRRFGVALKPKVVVWFFFEGNDLLDVERYEHFIKERDRIEAERNSFYQRSFLRNTLFTLAGYTAPGVSQDGVEAHRRSCRFQTKSGEESTFYLAYAATPLTEDERESLGKARDVLLQAQQLTAANDAQLVFVYIPTTFRVYNNLCKFPDDGYARSWQLSDLPQEMEKWCKEKGIPYLNLTTALKEAASRGELVYLLDDGHWSERGHQVTAETVARFIKSEGWLAAD
jgi:hypothetical protein